MLETLFVTVAAAADLHLEMKSDEGVHGETTWAANDAMTKRFGPGVSGKSSVTYEVSVMGAVWLPAESAYQVDFGLCVEWTRKGTPGRYCTKDDLLAPADHHTVTGSVKAKDKFGWSFDLWFTGDPPSTPAPPAPPSEPG